jgi:hypothetical protein
MGTSSVCRLVDGSLRSFSAKYPRELIPEWMGGEQNADEIINACLTCLANVSGWAVENSISPKGLVSLMLLAAWSC